jgi:hypothetical protein
VPQERSSYCERLKIKILSMRNLHLNNDIEARMNFFLYYVDSASANSK